MTKKSVLIIIIFFAFISINCKNDSVTNPMTQSSNPIASISGNFYKWANGSGKFVKLIMGNGTANSIVDLALSSIDSLGKFSLSSLQAPQDSYIFPDTGSIQSTVNFGGKNAKIGFGFLTINAKDTTSAYGFAWQFYMKDSIKTSSGDYQVNYLYSNQAFSITGYDRTKITSNFSGDSIGYTQNNYSINFKQGWNKMVAIISSLKDSTKVVKTITDQEPGGAKYYYTYNEPQVNKLKSSHFAKPTIFCTGK